MNTPTPTEQGELRIAIAEEMGFEHDGPWANYWILKKGPVEISITTDMLPPYTTSIDAIQAACLERFENKTDRDEITYQIVMHGIQQVPLLEVWQLTALDWCIVFAKTAKIWRYKE